jgi:hypothetical protein
MINYCEIEQIEDYYISKTQNKTKAASGAIEKMSKFWL